MKRALIIPLFFLSSCANKTVYESCPPPIEMTTVVPPVEQQKNGPQVNRGRDGITVTKNYNGGVLDGEVTYTFPYCETVEKREVYANGSLQKQQAHYFCGSRKEEVQHSPKGQNITSWYETGSPKSMEQYQGDKLRYGEYYNTENKLESQVKEGQGFRVKRNEYGDLLSTDTIEEGEMVSRTTYHPNGTPKEIISYNGGVVEGERKTFTSDGEPLTIEMWEGGSQHGLSVIFQNGEKYAEVPYDHGQKQGIEKRYKGGKTVIEEISWIDNKRQGPSYTYIGESVKTDYYFEGRQVSKIQYDNLSR